MWRMVLAGLGAVFTVIGAAGLVLPLLPGTLFLILAAACFTRSSPRFERWLLEHAWLGPPVRRWRERGVIPIRAKIFACVSIAASYGIVLSTDAPAVAKATTLVILVGVVGYIVTRPHA
jgi:uncharacterized membrane protein YbaN (DUF454 family)